VELSTEVYCKFTTECAVKEC